MKPFFACLALIFGQAVFLVGVSECFAAAKPSITEATTNQIVAASAPARIPAQVKADAYYRPAYGVFNQYATIEVYLTADQPIVWKRALLNGKEVKSSTNGVVWTSFMPSAHVAATETTLLQINVVSNPVTKVSIEVEAESGERANCSLPQYQRPFRKVTGVAFSSDFRQVYLTYTTTSSESSPPQVTINGMDCAASTRVLQVCRPLQEIIEMGRSKQPMPKAFANRHGMLAVTLSKPLKQGQPVHVRLQWDRWNAIETFVRSHWGISLDSFGVAEKDLTLRKELGLDARPFVRIVPNDPACNDVARGAFSGRSAPSIVADRDKFYKKGDDRLSGVHLCTACANHARAIYGGSGIADLVFVNPYRMLHSKRLDFIHAEMESFRLACEASAPRPWGWLPEAFCFQSNLRMLEPAELRLETLGALSHAIKAVGYFIYGGKKNAKILGFEASPALLTEIKQINKDLKTLEPLFGSALPLFSETVGDDKTGLRVSGLWSGEMDSLAVVVMNMDYQTDPQKPNLGGLEARFKIKPKENVRVRVAKPAWLTLGAVTDALTGENIPAAIKDDQIELDLGRMDLGRIIRIQSTNKTALLLESSAPPSNPVTQTPDTIQ